MNARSAPGSGTDDGRRPILVTGVPRSGTTWLARALASAPGTALTGREPMNPRGAQYGLGGTLSGWARLTSLSPRQARLLRASYRGTNPLVYSRFGHRQWAAPLPHTRIIVKDPFAMLSLPAIVDATCALPVLVYRHPAAVLSSYRRMGWTADLDEISALLPDGFDSHQESEALAMGRFWSALNNQALDDLQPGTQSIVVSHEEVAAGGLPAMRRLFELAGLRWSPAVESALQATGGAARDRAARPAGLHNFDRSPVDVARAWRADVTEADLAAVEGVCRATLEALAVRRVDLL